MMASVAAVRLGRLQCHKCTPADWVRNVLILAVISGVVSWVVATNQPDWAEITELHARYDVYGQHKVSISMALNKRQRCDRTLVSATMSRIADNAEQSERVALVGRLPDLIQDAPIGHSVLFDTKAPEWPLTAGQYALTVTATCVRDGAQSAQVTAPVKTVVTVTPNEVIP